MAGIVVFVTNRCSAAAVDDVAVDPLLPAVREHTVELSLPSPSPLLPLPLLFVVVATRSRRR